MKGVHADGLDRPLFAHDKMLGTVERQLYGHVLAAIDFDRLGQLESSLFSILVDGGMQEELALDMSTQLVDRALLRAIDDEGRHCDFGPPPGITLAERRAVAFDETCQLCREERAMAQQQPPAHEEACPCCDDLVRAWREEHAAVLAKAGLAGE